MIIVTGWIRFAPGGVEKLRAAAADLMIATRQETGCVAYALSADLAEPDLMRIGEIWENAEAMKAHGGQPHVAVFAAALRDAGAEAMSVKGYTGAFWRQILGAD